MTDDWTFGGSWPFEPRWFETADGRLHYVDEGPRDAPPVVLMHGNPSWGYLYRNFIPALVDAGYRVIVPDLLGAGQSDKPDRPELYRIRRHAQRTEQLLESLDLWDVTLVPHDWGMHSLWWAIRHPARVRSLFVLNSMAHRRRDDIKLPFAIRLFRDRGTGPLLVKRLDVVRRFFLFKFGIVHRERVTPQIKEAYLAPNPSAASRTGVLVFLREIPTGPSDPVSQFWGELEDGLERHFRDKPVGIAWGMQDAAFTPAVLDELWLGTFPHAVVTRVPDAGHLRPRGRLRTGRARVARAPFECGAGVRGGVRVTPTVSVVNGANCGRSPSERGGAAARSGVRVMAPRLASFWRF